MKSPSDFTNCGKSVVSLFSTQSGKTNHSAPPGAFSNCLADSPKHRTKLRGPNGPESADKQTAKQNFSIKKKLRPSSSMSPSNKGSFAIIQANGGTSAKDKFNMTSTGPFF